MIIKWHTILNVIKIFLRATQVLFLWTLLNTRAHQKDLSVSKVLSFFPTANAETVGKTKLMTAVLDYNS